jgi:sec-independent protein translocase protein TatA
VRPETPGGSGKGMERGTILLRRNIPMGRIGLPELMVILVIVIVIFGANRLPQLGKGIGSAIKNFKEGLKDETSDRKES